MNSRPWLPVDTTPAELTSVGTNVRVESVLRHAMQTLNLLIQQFNSALGILSGHTTTLGTLGTSYTDLIASFNSLMATVETIYGWGNHSEAGYLVQGNLDAYPGSAALVTAGDLEANSLTVGDMTLASGTSADNTITIGTEAGSTGDFGIFSKDTSGVNAAKFAVRAGVDSSVVFFPAAGNVKITGDAQKLTFGAADDASIQWDGTNLAIDPGVGILTVATAFQPAGYVSSVANGSHDGATDTPGDLVFENGLYISGGSIEEPSNDSKTYGRKFGSWDETLSSSWTGSTNIVTLGTVTSGTWAAGDVSCPNLTVGTVGASGSLVVHGSVQGAFIAANSSSGGSGTTGGLTFANGLYITGTAEGGLEDADVSSTSTFARYQGAWVAIKDGAGIIRANGFGSIIGLEVHDGITKTTGGMTFENGLFVTGDAETGLADVVDPVTNIPYVRMNGAWADATLTDLAQYDWDGNSSHLTPSIGRTSLELGNAATKDFGTITGTVADGGTLATHTALTGGNAHGISSWVGSANITTLGTITSGTWNVTNGSVTCQNITATKITASGYYCADGVTSGISANQGTTLLFSQGLLTKGRPVEEVAAGGTTYARTYGSWTSLTSAISTAMASWAGSTSITTVGTIGTGTWNANVILPAKGGTGIAGFTSGTAHQILGVNSGVTGYEFKTISGSTNINVVRTTGDIALSVAVNPTFGRVVTTNGLDIAGQVNIRSGYIVFG